MSQTWDFDYYTTLIVVTGVGDTLSEGVGDAGAPVSVTGAGDTLSEGVGVSLEHAIWPFDYVNLLVPVTGAGDTLSEGVGSAGAEQVWPFDYWDGVNNTAGFGDTLSQGVGSVTVLGPAEWYTIDGIVSGPVSVTGAGDTRSQGVGSVSVQDSLIVPVTGVGDTLSAGGSLVLGTVIPPGGIRLSPYWVPGEIAYAYRLHEWLGSYEARLGVGPGPVAQIAFGDPDTTVAFGGLEPGQYVAVQGRKRVHFLITP